MRLANGGEDPSCDCASSQQAAKGSYRRYSESRFDRKSRKLGQDSGDLEGLLRTSEADSESVDELVEEGNAVEAGALAGVEEADNANEKQAPTHEIPKDDVSKEYLDEQ